MHYVSTRAQAPTASFLDVLLQGPAPDGGLYVPAAYPRVDARRMAALPYAEAAVEILAPYVGDALSASEFAATVHTAYAGFDHPDVTPLRPLLPGIQLLELFHGPTLAFKDIALQLLGALTDAVLRRRGERITVLGATSGDTGPAAIAGFAACEYADVYILYPHGCPSDVQRRQMTCRPEARVHALAIEGTFDDCQRIVKALFADAPFRARARLTAVNSLNWMRIAAQSVYYVRTAGASVDDTPTAFSVPTGNFGNLFAAYTALRMGAPVGRLIAATNANDILCRTVREGRHTPKAVLHTRAPAMDIQVASNFERMLFELSGRDGDRVRTAGGDYELTLEELSALQALFAAHAVDDAALSETMRRVYGETGVIIDPHTAVGVHAALQQGLPDTVCLACAHPAKFPQTIEQVLGVPPELPASVRDLFALPERLTVLPANTDAVRAHIAATI